MAYAAGYLDGEGCFTTNNYGTARIVVSCTFPTVLRKLKKIFGGSIHKCKPRPINKKTVWSWQISGLRAVLVLREIRPFLKEKRLQGDLLIKLWSNKDYYASNPSKKKAIVKKLKDLKQVDYKKKCANRSKKFKKGKQRRVVSRTT